MFRSLWPVAGIVAISVSVMGCGTAAMHTAVTRPVSQVSRSAQPAVQTSVTEPTPSPAPSTLAPSQGYVLDGGTMSCSFVTGDTDVYFTVVGSCDQAGQFIAQVTGVYWNSVPADGNADLPLADAVCVFQGQDNGSTVMVVSDGTEGAAICQDMQASGWIPEPVHNQ